MDWKWIDGYENLYKICQNGDVISCKFNKEKVLKQSIDSTGYLKVDLCKNDKEGFKIHRLIAIHFIENPNNFSYIQHINGDKIDNRIENLRWIDRKNKGKYKKGVYFNKASNKFIARIWIDNKQKYLGSFETELEANEKYMEKYNELMKDF